MSKHNHNANYYWQMKKFDKYNRELSGVNKLECVNKLCRDESELEFKLEQEVNGAVSTVKKSNIYLNDTEENVSNESIIKSAAAKNRILFYHGKT